MQPLLAGWTNFYVVIGTCAGALIGLQFVVMTLLAGSQSQGSMQEIRAFGSPTVVHFSVALLVSALMTAPWPTALPLAYVLGSCGVLCTAYSIRTIWHAWKSKYNPDLEDWIWYTGLPLVTDIILGSAGFLLLSHPASSLFTVAAVTVAFLFIGIHNAWDTVTFIATRSHEKSGNTSDLTKGE